MATAVPTKPDTAARYESELEQQLAQTTRRIRLNDVLTGALLLVAITLGYVAGMIAVDRWADVPAWGRQCGLVALLGTLGGVGYFTVLRPLRRAVNPLFAAKQVEDTLPDAKNSIVNYVDLHDKPLPESIKSAVGAKAVKQFQSADVNEAVESRGLVWAGVAVAVVVVALAVLFLLFRPTQFFSLLGRAVTPFSAGGIVTRTQIAVAEPAGGDTTVTAGQPVKVVVTVSGRVPDPAGPDRLRLRLRRTQSDADAEEVALEPAGSNREWKVHVPDHLVQNGFWYTVAGGDAVTPEYRVKVQSRPLFTGFEVRYEYPPYLRLKPEVVREPQLDGYRGTQLTITARANRELKAGQMVVTPTGGSPLPAIPAEVVGEGRDSLRFRYTLAENGSYRLHFTSAADEQNADAPACPIRVISDQPPAVTITSPGDEQIVFPANGQLDVDAVIGDDFGIDTVTLRLRLADGGGRMIQPKPYQDGKSFKREVDGTYPTSLEYKDAVPLTGLKDGTGKPVVLTEGMILEYWLEAVDNCTVPRANTGISKVQRVRLGAPITEPAKRQEQQQQAAQRQQADARHQQEQNAQLQNERRDPPAQPHADAESQNQTGGQNPNEPKANQDGQRAAPDQAQKPGGPQPERPPGQPGGKSTNDRKSDSAPDQSEKPNGGEPNQGPRNTKPDAPATKDQGTPPTQQQPMTGAGNPGQQPSAGKSPEQPGGTAGQEGPKSDPMPNPDSKTTDQQDEIKRKAQDILKEASKEQNRQQQQPGEARGAEDHGAKQADQPAESKPGNDPAGTPRAETKPKDEAKQGNSAEPKQPGSSGETPAPTEPKSAPPTKPEPGNQTGDKKGEPESKQPPVGGSAGTEKPEPKRVHKGATRTPTRSLAKPAGPATNRSRRLSRRPVPTTHRSSRIRWPRVKAPRRARRQRSRPRNRRSPVNRARPSRSPPRAETVRTPDRSPAIPRRPARRVKNRRRPRKRKAPVRNHRKTIPARSRSRAGSPARTRPNPRPARTRTR